MNKDLISLFRFYLHGSCAISLFYFSLAMSYFFFSFSFLDFITLTFWIFKNYFFAISCGINLFWLFFIYLSNSLFLSSNGESFLVLYSQATSSLGCKDLYDVINFLVIQLY